MSALVQQLALVSESARVELSDLMRVAAALQKQASRDLAPIWEVSASVDAFATLSDVPPGYWSMIVKDNIGFQAAGIHLDENGQPFALITSSDDIDVWSLTASHEALEMLVDPFGNRLMAGDSPKPDQERVNFLVEVCDPSESAAFGYSVNGIRVSDFYTPNYFDPMAAPGVRYSFTGVIGEPRDVLRGGYLSWVDLATNIWWQEIWFDGAASRFRQLGILSSAAGSMRSQIDRITAQDTLNYANQARRATLAAGIPDAKVKAVSSAWAERMQTQIEAIVASAAATGPGGAGEVAAGVPLTGAVRRTRAARPVAATARFPSVSAKGRRRAPHAWK